MRRIPLSLRFILAFSFAGLLFSGYLAGVKLLTSSCAFGESCPYVLGVPACFYGFALYIVLTTIAVLCARERIAYDRTLVSSAAVSLLGVLFAGVITVGELPTYFRLGFEAYTFGVPTCFLGLVFFMLILVVSEIAYAHERERRR